MPDRFTETKRVGYGSRIGSSFGGILIGLLLFVASFVVLFWNEGRTDLSVIARTSTPIASEEVSAEAHGQFVSTTGDVLTEEVFGDELFLKPGNYLSMQRGAEMYAWVEKTSTNTETNLGGSQDVETTYEYVKEWTSVPQDSSKFRYPEDHTNPGMMFKSSSKKAASATVGAYAFNPTDASIPGGAALLLSTENTDLTKHPTATLSSSYVYIPRDDQIKEGEDAPTLTTPNVGDIRVSYSALAPGFNGTLFGRVNGGSIERFTDEDNNSIFRLFAGSRDSGISAMHGEFTMLTWILRFVGFFMMWFGLSSFLGPISVLLDVVPMFGSISRSLIGFITFLVALVLSVLTILISMILHNIWALIVLALIGVGVTIWILRKKQATA